MIYTLIGSRETPPSAQEILINFSYEAASRGYIGRSGAARGADECLEKGVDLYIKERGLPRTSKKDLQEIYIPWQGFQNKSKHFSGIYDVSGFENREEGMKIAESLHPAWDNCSEKAKLLHGRNPYQILGNSLNRPSDFVILWGKTPNMNDPLVTGGTRTAMKLALDNGVKVYNINNVKDLEDVINFFK